MDIRSIIDTNDAPPSRKPTLPSASGQPLRSPSDPIFDTIHGPGVDHELQRESKARQLSSVQTSPYQDARYLQSPYTTISPSQASSPPGRTPAGSFDGQRGVHGVASLPFGSTTPDSHPSPAPARRTSSMGIGSMLNAAPPSPRDSKFGNIQPASSHSDSSAPTPSERKASLSSSREARQAPQVSPLNSSNIVQPHPIKETHPPPHLTSSAPNSSNITMSPSKAQKRSCESTI